jgi:cysteinyl-tRNA synthetase
MARKANDYQRADAIRDGLKQRGVMLMDDKNVKGDHHGQEVTTWRYWENNGSGQQPGPPPPPGPPGPPGPPQFRLSEHEIVDLIQERNVARKAGDYPRSDAIRNDLQARGVVLQDEKGQLGTTWRYWDEQGPPPRA